MTRSVASSKHLNFVSPETSIHHLDTLIMTGGYVNFFRKVLPQADDSSSYDSESADSSESTAALTRSQTLNAYLECDAIDEYNFQVQAALLSTKVLKLLEQQDLMNEKTASKLRHFSRTSGANSFMHMASPVISMSSPTSSGLFPTVGRTRSSSWLSTHSIRGIARSPTASMADGPLLDKILDAHSPSNPVPTHEIVKMMNLLTNLHSYCPETNTVGAPMGATCTVSDYTQVIASPDAMTRLVMMIRDMIEEKAPTPLVPVTVPAGGRLVVCGDTHAQLQDLMWVLFKNGVPSPSNIYIFNGDICDRGGHAVEIFLILLLFKLNWYNSVHIVRGNHEDDYCNIYYGFLAELKHKFGPLPGGMMHAEFLRLFYSLPLSCVIDNWVGTYRCNVTGALIEVSLASSEGPSSPSMGSPKTAHAGTEVVLRRKDATSGHRAFIRNDQLVFDTRTAARSLSSEGTNILRWGSANDTWEYISPRILVLHGGIPIPPASAPSNSVMLKHFHDLPHRMKIPPAPKTVLEQWMYQILWSDPAEDGGPKGRGTPFFAHHTQAFIEANNLAAVIRAHQVPANQRGVSFHHRQKLITIFTASNYCGSSQNYGGVAVFTPTLFPALAINRTLFEHWAPPLSVIRDVLAKHQNATQDVRLFIAHEIETERAPTERSSIGSLSHLEQKVGEYVASLIVFNKRQLWTAFNSKARSNRPARFAIAVDDWVDVCGKIIGHHFPWGTLLNQLEIDLVANSSIDFASFLNRFRSNVRFGETLVDTWDCAVVRGFLYELISRDQAIQKSLIAESLNGPFILADKFKGIILSACPTLTGAQATLFVQTLLECAPANAGQDMLEISAVFKCMSEYIRSYFSLLDAAPDSVPSEAVIQTGRDAIEFFSALREAIGAKYSGPDPIYQYFKAVVANGTAELVVPVMEAGARVEASLANLGLCKFKSTALNCLYFVASDENELNESGNVDLSLVRFYAACFIDGTSQGELLKARIAEHATAAIYFHRNALRCACVHLDKSRCGQIDRHAFQRALLALNGSLELEWKLTKHQLRCVIEYIRWQEMERALPEQGDGEFTRSIEEEDKQLVIEYDLFLDSFEISDRQRMSRACSFGWHLVKDSLNMDFSIGDAAMQ